MWILGAIALAGAAWFAFGQGAGTTTDTGQQTAGQSSMVSDESFDEQTTLAAIQARGGSWKCDVSSTGPTANSSGTVYVAGERLRGDFTSEVPQVGMTIDSHIVSDGSYTYTWSSAAAQGVKAKVTTEGEAGGKTSDSQTFDSGATMDYKCSAWPTDESKFAVPSDVTFREF